MMKLLQSLLESLAYLKQQALRMQDIALGFDFVEDVQIVQGKNSVNYYKNSPLVLVITFKNGGQVYQEVVGGSLDWFETEGQQSLRRVMKHRNPATKNGFADKLVDAVKAEFGKLVRVKRSAGEFIAHSGYVYKTEADLKRNKSNGTLSHVGSFVYFQVEDPRSAKLGIKDYNDSTGKPVVFVKTKSGVKKAYTVQDAIELIRSGLDEA